ncbi:hypothetical protein [Caballeronia sp. LZ001]|nr:hypothetical protein [Caballeronia sp. LZ001]MDR5802159.1 hypothetical protein [Caballeronia sp. LZ001]
MWKHTYHDFKYGIVESLDFICTTGHAIHERFRTIHYDEVVWC